MDGDIAALLGDEDIIVYKNDKIISTLKEAGKDVKSLIVKSVSDSLIKIALIKANSVDEVRLMGGSWNSYIQTNVIANFDKSTIQLYLSSLGDFITISSSTYSKYTSCKPGRSYERSAKHPSK